MIVRQNTNSDPSEWRAPVVALVGIGMGKDDLTERALEFVARAEALAGGKRQLELFPNHPGKRIILQSPLDDALAELERVSRDRRTVVLASGDPLFYGIGRRLLDLLGRERIAVVPNITALQALCARIAEPWDDVWIASLHGREDAGWLDGVRAGLKTAIFTDARHTPAWIARSLVDSGLGGGFRTLVVAEDMGLPSESIRSFTPDEALGLSFSPPPAASYA